MYNYCLLTTSSIKTSSQNGKRYCNYFSEKIVTCINQNELKRNIRVYGKEQERKIKIRTDKRPKT